MTQAPLSRDMLPPDEVASLRWLTSSQVFISDSVLHQEVAKRMADRLKAFRRIPQRCLDWQPSLGGVLAANVFRTQGMQLQTEVYEPTSFRMDAVRRAYPKPWWSWRQSIQQAAVEDPLRKDRFDLVWSNLGLHASAHPNNWLLNWHHALEPGGAIIFSCFGPDTLQELGDIYAEQAWAYPCQDWMDMHDWGDVLQKNGWMDPVMDVERLILTYKTPEDVLHDLRSWGRNLHSLRFEGCRTQGWRNRLIDAIENKLSKNSDGRFRLTFEIIQGHALKASAAKADPHIQTIPLSTLKNWRSTG